MTEEIAKRIFQAEIAFNKNRALFPPKNIGKRSKKNLLKTYNVCTILLYGNETWTILIEEQKILEAFEMWVL